MKKILFLLLSTVAMYGQVPADATPLENIQITNNQTSTTATKINVQENDGTINTISKSDLVNYVEFASAVNLPVTGEQGKLYLTKDNNRLYRFNGTIYQELTTDISGKEDIANKQNSLAVDGTNTKYPTITAVNTGLALKANLASPALTGTPTAPTATAGTNTTQIATTAFVTGANAGNVKLTGNQTISGVKSFSANTSYPLNNGVQLNNTSNDSTYGAGALLINNNGQGFGSSILNNSTGYGLGLLNMSTGSGLQLQQSSNGRLINLSNLGAGVGIGLSNNLTGTGIRVDGASSGNNFISSQILTGTGFNYVGQNSGLNTFTVDKFGATTATSFIKSSTPATNILLAGGGDIAQSTFPLANGTRASGTWGINISGTAANSTLWNGISYDGAFQDQPISYILSRDVFSDTYKRTSDANIKSWLGLGSNAYTSTDYFKYETFTADANTLPGNRSAFTYTLNAPHTGTLVHFGAVGYGTQINTNSSSGDSFSFRTSNGDILAWNPWRKMWHDGNFNPANYLPLSGGTLTGIVTATSYTATSLPVFENNAAASSLAVGQFYRTSIGVLMVKF